MYVSLSGAYVPLRCTLSFQVRGMDQVKIEGFKPLIGEVN